MLDFPNSPTLNQVFTGPNNALWRWDGAKWLGSAAATTGYAPINSPQFSGDPQAPTASVGDADASIATTAFVSAAVRPALNDVGRNLIHNPLFNVAQRGAGPWTGIGGYSADRWLMTLPVTMHHTPTSTPFNTSYNNGNSFAATPINAGRVRPVFSLVATGSGYAISDITLSADL